MSVDEDEAYGLHCDIGRLERENARLLRERDEWRRVAESKQDIIDHMRDASAENAKLREQMERLVTLLHNDCDIDASWDGLRKFWSIGLTENGCLMRDRACKAEAERDPCDGCSFVGPFPWVCDTCEYRKEKK